MPFTLIRNKTGDYDLYINGFHMPEFSVQKDYFKLQDWDQKGKVEIWEPDRMISNEQNEQIKADAELIKAIGKLLKGENNDPGSNTEGN
jgi:hypothetical protein